MTNAKVLLAALACASLAACGLPPLEHRPEPGVELVRLRHQVTFPAGTTELTLKEKSDLEQFIATVRPEDDDRVIIVGADASDRLGERRRQIVSSYLSLQGVTADPARPDERRAAATEGEVTVVVERYVVHLPPCPNWTDRPNTNFWNQPGRNWGCATAVNFGLTVASPADLARPRELEAADGTVSARAVQQYRAGKTKDLIRDAASAEIFPSSGGSE